ncbi:hypothetical protein N9Y67_04675 [Pseudomonadota bacterium]|nr:hypothetical protein [Pseudomonadota bacterium]
MTNKHRIAYLLLLLLCSVLLFIPLESNIGQQLTSMLTITLSVYAVLRGLNGVISMAQGTELSIEPMGVGVTLTPGELLDPLNDLIEQVSSVLLVASASIGIQKILLSLTDISLLRWLLVILAIITMLVVALKKLSETKQKLLIRIVIVLSILRLMVPAMVVTSSVMQSWLEADRQHSISVLVSTEQEVRALNHSTSNNKSSGWFESIADKLQLTDLFSSLKSKSDGAVTAAISILAEFLLVFIFIPIVFMSISYKLIVRI